MTQQEAVEAWWSAVDEVTRRRALRLSRFDLLPADMQRDLVMHGVTVIAADGAFDGAPEGYVVPDVLREFLGERRAERLAAKLHPDAVRLAMVRAGAVLTGYELVRAQIVDGVRGFYLTGFDEHGLTYSRGYDVEVLTLAKNPVRASLLWLQEHDALTAEQVEAFEGVRRHRHEVAHELARFIADPEADVDLDRLRDLRDCCRSLDRFFGAFEVAANPEFDNVDVDLDAVRSGTTLLLGYLFELAGLDDHPGA